MCDLFFLSIFIFPHFYSHLSHSLIQYPFYIFIFSIFGWGVRGWTKWIKLELHLDSFHFTYLFSHFFFSFYNFFKNKLNKAAFTYVKNWTIREKKFNKKHKKKIITQFFFLDNFINIHHITLIIANDKPIENIFALIIPILCDEECMYEKNVNFFFFRFNVRFYCNSIAIEFNINYQNNWNGIGQHFYITRVWSY